MQNAPHLKVHFDCKKIAEFIFYSFIPKSSAIISELSGVNKKIAKPIKRTPIPPKNITLLFDNNLCLTTCEPAPRIRKIPNKRMIK